MQVIKCFYEAVLSTYENLRAGEDTFLNDVEVVAIITLFDDCLASSESSRVHGSEHNLEFLWVQS